MWDDGFSKTRRALEAIPRLNRRDARDNWNYDSGSANSFHPVDEYLYIIKHLRENEVGTSVYLVLQVLHFKIAFGRREELILRKTCDRNVKVVTIVALNMSNEVDAIYKAAFYGFPLVFAGGGIAPKCEDISTTMIFGFLPYRERQDFNEIKKLFKTAYA